jgi:hypothetical protein
LKASVVGSSVTLIVRDSVPVLGVLQGVYFREFDGPRRRQYYVKVTGDTLLDFVMAHSIYIWFNGLSVT